MSTAVARRAAIAVFILVVGAASGWWLAGLTMDHAGGAPDSPAQTDDNGNEILYWVAPMDSNYRRDGPGKSPMGMDLVPVYAKERGDDSALRIRPETLNAIGVRSAPVARLDLTPEFTAPAAVRPNADAIAHIHVRTEGWVETLSASAVGNRVAQGDLLFEIYSPALVSAQEEYLQANAAGRANLIRAGEERLRALGMLPGQIKELREENRVRPLFRQRAPQDGIILELNIRRGMYVRPGTTIMSLADVSTVWLEAALFPSQLEHVEVGGPLMFQSLNRLSEPRAASVDYIHPTVDEETRTVPVRAVVANDDRTLRPGQFIRTVFRGPVREQVLAVPSAAVIRSGGSTRVILEEGEGRFRPAEVTTGLVTTSHTEILHGLEEGERVVVSAQFLIDSEASLEPALMRMHPPSHQMNGHEDHQEHQEHQEQHEHSGHEAHR